MVFECRLREALGVAKSFPILAPNVEVSILREDLQILFLSSALEAQAAARFPGDLASNSVQEAPSSQSTKDNLSISTFFKFNSVFSRW